MNRLVRYACALSLAAALAATTQAASRPDPANKRFSWADAGHGWVLYQDLPLGSCEGVLCGTEDGGRSWRGIFRAREWAGSRFVRTSARAGVHHVRLAPGYSDAYWTPDAGRHWYRTRTLGGRLRPRDTSLFQMDGHGSFLYWHRGGGRLFRVERWPPTRAPHCPGSWRLDPMGGPRAGTAVWGRICVGQPVDVGMRRVVAARLSSGRFWQLERAPQGVVALLAPVGNRPRVFVQRAGRSRVAVLPRASLAPGHRVEGYELTSEWPRLTLCGGLMGPAPPLGDLEPVGSIVWQSSDGGATWRSGVGAAFEKPYCDEQTIE